LKILNFIFDNFVYFLANYSSASS